MHRGEREMREVDSSQNSRQTGTREDTGRISKPRRRRSGLSFSSLFLLLISLGALGASLKLFGVPGNRAGGSSNNPAPDSVVTIGRTRILEGVRDAMLLSTVEFETEMSITRRREQQRPTILLPDGWIEISVTVPCKAYIGCDFRKIGPDDIAFRRTGDGLFVRLTIPEPEVLIREVDNINMVCSANEYLYVGTETAMREMMSCIETVALDSLEARLPHAPSFEDAKEATRERVAELVRSLGVDSVQVTFAPRPEILVADPNPIREGLVYR